MSSDDSCVREALNHLSLQVNVASTGSSTEGGTTTIFMVVADPGKAGWQRLDNELRAIDRAVHGSQMTVEAVPVGAPHRLLTPGSAVFAGQRSALQSWTGVDGACAANTRRSSGAV